MTKVATKIYGASNVTASTKVKKQLSDWENAGFGKYPICVAKTQSSFSQMHLSEGLLQTIQLIYEKFV